MRIHAVRRIVACAAACAVALAWGCGRASSEAPPAAASADSGGERSFPLTGEVISVDAGEKVLVVRHNEVVGYMPAMTMEFPVSAGDAAAAQAGRAHPRRAGRRQGGQTSASSRSGPTTRWRRTRWRRGRRMLRQDTIAKGKQAYREVGDAAPDFALYDQNGRVVDSARFRGKQVMLNFIYTRCPVANMCPPLDHQDDGHPEAREEGRCPEHRVRLDHA